MKKGFVMLLIVAIRIQGAAQVSSSPSQFILLSEDNDGINAWFKGQDWGYTNGTAFHFFQLQKKKPLPFFSRLIPFADKNSRFSSGWGLVQLMYTPKRISPSVPDRDDYAYAGGLLVSHSLQSGDDKRKISMHGEWIAGLMGPASFARQTQSFLHHLIGDPKPNGWGYQLPTDLLLNYNLRMEKGLAGNSLFEIAGGGQVSLGTLRDGLSAFVVFRLKHNLSSYGDLSDQYFSSRKKQVAFSLSLTPSVDLSLYNALLDGGLFNKDSPVNNRHSKYGTTLNRKKLVGQLEGTLRFSWHFFSLSFSQQLFTPEFGGYEGHNVGSLSLGVAL